MFGVNIDGDGEQVGLWFDRDRVDEDGFVYVSLTEAELQRLARMILNTPPDES